MFSWDYGWLKIERRPGRYYLINADYKEVVKTFQKAWKMAGLIENLIKFKGIIEGHVNHGDKYKFDWEPASGTSHGEIDVRIKIGNNIKINMFGISVGHLVDQDFLNKVQNFRNYLSQRIDNQYDFESYFSERTTNLFKFSSSLDPILDQLEELEKEGENIRPELIKLYIKVENQIHR